MARQDELDDKPLAAALVYLVGAGPGDPGLITVRGVECLQMAQVVVCDRLASRALRCYAPDAEWIDVGKQPDHHPVPQAEINRLLVEQASAGRVVVRLKGGDPFVFGRGGEEAQALVEAGIPFEVVPGVTSAIAVPAYAGIPVTQRGLTTSLAVITGHRSQDIVDGLATLDCAALSAGTRVFLMGVNSLPGLVARMLESGCSPETPAAVIEQGTTPHQKVRMGTLANIVAQAADIRPPAITVVGEVVRLRQQLAWFDDLRRRPLLGLRILHTRPADVPGPLRAYGPDDFSRRLELLGAEVLHLPAARLLPPAGDGDMPRAIQRIAASASVGAQGLRPAPSVPSRPDPSAPPIAFDWIVFTSANAVHFFFECLYSLGYDARILSGARLGAVGPATAGALAGQHLQADFVPQRHTGLDWALEAPVQPGQRILLPRSEIAEDDLRLALQQRGVTVEAVTAYRVAAAAPDPQALQALVDGQIDVVTLFSPSALRGLLAMLAAGAPPGAPQPAGDWALAVLNRQAAACIGPTTARAAQQLGLRVDITAQSFTAAGLVEALIKWRAR